MKLRLSLVAAAAASSFVLWCGVASAEEPDGARFRGGVALEGGAIVVPDSVTLGVAGVQGQLGAQINNLVGVYVAPSLDVVFGEVGGINIGAAALVDFTFDDSITVGAGPDVGAFAAIGGSSTSVSAAAGALYGGRIHFGYSPVVGDGEDGIRRKALTLGVDLRLLSGAAGQATVTQTGGSASANTFIFAPSLSIGYSAF